MPRLVEARYIRDYVIWLRFSDGAEGEVDLAGELEGPVFEPLRGPSYFRLFTLNPSLHTIAWPNGRIWPLSSSTNGSAFPRSIGFPESGGTAESRRSRKGTKLSRAQSSEPDR